MAVVAVLAIVLPAWIVTSQQSATPAPSLAVQWVIVAVAAVRLSSSLVVGRVNLTLTTFYLYVYVFLGVSALAQMVAGAVPSPIRSLTNLYLSVPKPIDPGIALRTSALVLVGIAAYETGRAMRRNAVARHRESGREQGREDGPPACALLDPLRVRALAVVALLLSAAYVGVIGPARLFGSRIDLERSVAERFPEALGPMVVAFGTIPVVCAFLSLLIIRSTLPHGERFGSSLALVATGATAFIVVNPLTSPRFVVGVFYGSLTLVMAVKAGASAVRAAVVLFSFLLVVVFPYSDLFRYSREANLNSTGVITLFQSKLDYDSFGQIGAASALASDHGFRDGLQALGAALFWVPRTVWPGKPVDTGIILADYQGYDFTNVSAPLWAEAYLDFGVVGVVVTFAALGWISQRLDDGFAAAPRHLPAVVFLVVPLISLYQVILLRGSLIAILGRLLAILLVSALLVRREVSREARLGHLWRPGRRGGSREAAPANARPPRLRNGDQRRVTPRRAGG